MCSFFSARAEKKSSSVSSVRFRSYSLLTVSRLIGIGTSFPSTRAQNSMFVVAPLRELRKVLEHVGRVRMEDMRSILMHKDSVIVVMIVSVAANVIATVADKDALVEFARQPLSDDAAGKSRANDEIVEHDVSESFRN